MPRSVLVTVANVFATPRVITYPLNTEEVPSVLLRQVSPRDLRLLLFKIVSNSSSDTACPFGAKIIARFFVTSNFDETAILILHQPKYNIGYECL